MRGLDWEELFVEELGGGSKYRLFCLFCTSTYLNVFEMSYTSVQSIVFIYIYMYIYTFLLFLGMD